MAFRIRVQVIVVFVETAVLRGYLYPHSTINVRVTNRTYEKTKFLEVANSEFRFHANNADTPDYFSGTARVFRTISFRSF